MQERTVSHHGIEFLDRRCWDLWKWWAISAGGVGAEGGELKEARWTCASAAINERTILTEKVPVRSVRGQFPARYFVRPRS